LDRVEMIIFSFLRKISFSTISFRMKIYNIAMVGMISFAQLTADPPPLPRPLEELVKRTWFQIVVNDGVFLEVKITESTNNLHHNTASLLFSYTCTPCVKLEYFVKTHNISLLQSVNKRYSKTKRKRRNTYFSGC
jgi:hypothetical protein